MPARRIDIRETVVDFSFTVRVPWPRSPAGKSIPWKFGKQMSHRIQYDDPIMEYHAFGRGPIGYWIRGDEATGDFTVVSYTDKLYFNFEDENTAFLFKMRFL